MKEVDVSTGLQDDKPLARRLSPEFYHVYAIEDTSQINLYKRLAEFVEQQEQEVGVLVESLNPSVYEEGDQYYYTMVITLAG